MSCTHLDLSRCRSQSSSRCAKTIGVVKVHAVFVKSKTEGLVVIFVAGVEGVVDLLVAVAVVVAVVDDVVTGWHDGMITTAAARGWTGTKLRAYQSE